ncbi:MAG: hypothetical protein Q7T86_16375 [Hyphomicrobiaceae bacterium]|nr:hypothetical protein [Hyphomicrobiaceae bacterium]
MLRQSILHVLAIAPLFGFAFAPAARADDPSKVSGPHTHENLSIYFIHGKSADGPVPLTLEEALAKGFVEVHETDTVSQLVVENKGREEVFVHAGDIVKGGKQDRVVTASFVLPAKSKKIEVPVYCVEAGRWAPRGAEDSRKFMTSAEMLPTKEAKLAMMAAPGASSQIPTASLSARADPRDRGVRRADREQRTVDNAEPQQPAETLSNSTDSLTERGPAGGQSEVWRNVAAIQEKLSMKLKKKVASDESESSLQLALEDKDLAAEQERYVKALQAAGEAGDDIVGYAIAVNGKIASADVYPSNALFKKLWPRLLKTAVTEAIGAEDVKDVKAPAMADVELFLARDDAKEETDAPVAGISTTARASAASYDTETTRGGQFLHRSKVAR